MSDDKTDDNSSNTLDVDVDGYSTDAYASDANSPNALNADSPNSDSSNPSSRHPLDRPDLEAASVDAESILLTLDQLGQTVDIMNGVIGRLRNHIHNHVNTLEVIQQEAQRLDLRQKNRHTHHKHNTYASNHSEYDSWPQPRSLQDILH